VVALDENDALYSPQVILNVGGRNSLSLIDTGSGECMALPAPFAETLPYKVKPAVTGFSQNISGTTEDRSGRLDLEVELGGHTVAEPIVDLIAPDYYRLGGALLSNFTITFDSANSLVRFARGESEAARCESVMSIGFYVGRIDDKWIVALLLPGAESLEIKKGDQLLAIGDTAVTELERTAIKDLWKSEKEITITLNRDGKEIKRVVPVRTMVP
jgi:hypothetical protein